MHECVRLRELQGATIVSSCVAQLCTSYSLLSQDFPWSFLTHALSLVYLRPSYVLNPRSIQALAC
jgi:hypothetical protein